MRHILILPLVLTLAASARAASAPPKPNTMTQDEITVGGILLWDGETTFGWKSPNDSKWTIKDGTLASPVEQPGLLVTTSPFKDYVLEFEFQRKTGTTGTLDIDCDDKGQPRNPEVKRGKVKLIDENTNGWTLAHIEVRGGSVELQTYHNPNGHGTTDTTPPAAKTPNRSGYIALSGNGIVFRNLKLTPTIDAHGTDSLFNEKDLSGWKEFPGKKSKFSVTKNATIHLEGGPGDLQTEEQWSDFVLQLDCISNGDHCNSGVFFRCIPGEFENGYECQIRNEFTPEPKQEYTIEEYDSKTHELKGTTKEKHTAVDYGTGAVYRRSPARKELSKDREWFGMTIVASGRHIATWVNGVQEVDWTDERPINDNPRKGCRLEKGAISLQGHEAAVEDLDFANIRIQDLTAADEKKP